MAETPSTPKRRRWVRISLRSFLLLVTIGCVTLGSWVYRAERQRRVVEWIGANGGKATYGDQLADDASPFHGWVRDYLGVDYCHAVIRVRFFDPPVSDFSPLGNLPRLEHLVILPAEERSGLYHSYHRSAVTDVSSLSTLTNLKSLAGIEAINSVHRCYDASAWHSLHHYVLWFHDSTFECIAESFEIELHSENFTTILADLCKRLLD